MLYKIEVRFQPMTLAFKGYELSKRTAHYPQTVVVKFYPAQAVPSKGALSFPHFTSASLLSLMYPFSP